MTQVSGRVAGEAPAAHPRAGAAPAGPPLPPDRAGSAAAWFGTLADPSRVRILHALSLGPELCVCDLAATVSMSVSALSHQLRFLRERGVVGRRKSGRTVFYALADDHVRHVLADTLSHLSEPAGRP